MKQSDSYAIVRDSPDKTRSGRAKKYAKTFATMEFGDAVKCRPDEVASIASALRRFIVDNKLVAHVKSVSDYGDKMGRVWMLKS